MRRLVTRLLAPVFSASLLLGSAGIAAADAPATYVIDPYFCALTDYDGNPIEPAVIPAGTDVLIFQGWFTGTRGQLTSFAENATWVLSVNGQSVDVSPTLTDFYNLRPGLWAQFFVYDAGAASGTTFTTHYDIVMRAASFDGSAHYAKGSLYSPGIDCSFPVV